MDRYHLGRCFALLTLGMLLLGCGGIEDEPAYDEVAELQQALFDPSTGQQTYFTDLNAVQNLAAQMVADRDRATTISPCHHRKAASVCKTCCASYGKIGVVIGTFCVCR